MKLTLLLSLILISPISFANKDKVVAVVNGEKIFLSELMSSFNQNKLFLSQKKITKEKVLEDLINRRLGIQKAKKQKLEQNSVVKEKMDDILYHAMVSKDLEPRLQKITVSDSEVQEYYKENKEYRTAHILFRLPAVSSKNQIQAALAKAAEIYKEVSKKPDQFGQLANKYSQSTASIQGGDLGFQPPIRLAPEYFEAIKGQKEGFISKPVRTQFGYHIIKVLGVKDFAQINKDLYKKIIYDMKRDKILNAYFEQQRNKAKVSINKKNF